jgi:hypothetical protein
MEDVLRALDSMTPEELEELATLLDEHDAAVRQRARVMSAESRRDRGPGGRRASMQFPSHPEWQQVLTDILAGGPSSGSDRGRRLRSRLDPAGQPAPPGAIVRDFASRHGITELEGFQPEFLSPASTPGRRCRGPGSTPRPSPAGSPSSAGTGWSGFFTSEACLKDIPVRGAAAYARRAHATGVQLVYLTAARSGCAPGTEEVLRRFGFPLPGAASRSG